MAGSCLLSLLVLASAALLSAGGQALGATLYVGPGETYKTIQAGVDAARPGDTVIVRDGIYTDRTSIGYCNVGVNVTHGGTDEDDRITIRAEHKRGAVVDLQHEPGALGFRIGEGVSYVTIQDFEIRNCGTVSPSFDDWGVGISSWGSNPQPARLHNTYRGNLIHHCDLGMDDCGTSEYYTIDGNVFHHIGGEYHKHAVYFTSSNGTVTNNLFYDNIEGYPLHFNVHGTLENVLISNNTFVRGSRSSPIVFTSDLRNIVIQNNIFYQPASGQSAIEFYDRYHPRSPDNLTSIAVRNNLLYGSDSPLFDPKVAGFITHNGNLTGDPLFVNPAPGADDYRLRSGSPAIDAGIARLAPGTDGEGKARPSGGGYDMGAYESGGRPAQAAALPEGYGLAARYPGDQGIAEDPAVVFAEDFEVKDLDELQTRWSELGTHYPRDEKKSALFIDASAPAGSPGARSLRITATKDEDEGGFLYKVLGAGYDRLFLRFYVKFADDYGYCHHFAGLRGEANPPPVLRGRAGVRPDSYWISLIDANAPYWLPPVPPPGIWHFYTYWPEMRSWQNEDGTANSPLTEDAYYGNSFNPEPSVPVVRGQWICVEMMVQMNSAPDKADGEQALWIDGKLVGHYGPGSLTGRWSYDRFVPGDKGNPFEGFRWRSDPRVKPNAVFLRNYVSTRSFESDEKYAKEHPDFQIDTQQATVWFDHMVVSREYVGPLKPAR